MDDIPDLAAVARLMGERSRATMLICLMSGQPLTATELARAACVSKQTASSHLSKLVEARLVAAATSGRHRYFRLAHPEVGTVIERLMGLAHRIGAISVIPGPADPALRKARVCYDHLAGELGVFVFERLQAQSLLRSDGDRLGVTGEGARFFQRMGIDVASLASGRRPLCLACLDWSVRRDHLAGALGARVLVRCFALGWARRQRASRAVIFSAVGERALLQHLR
jgi:DNA-binding transcriptional ArsR family regulator